LHKEHAIVLVPGEAETMRHQRNTTSGLPKYWKLERRTVEKSADP
jgi:hypothetical protein